MRTSARCSTAGLREGCWNAYKEVRRGKCALPSIIVNMKKQSFLAIALSLFALFLAINPATVKADPIPARVDKFGNVFWCVETFSSPCSNYPLLVSDDVPRGSIQDAIPPNSRIIFKWTNNGLPHQGYFAYPSLDVNDNNSNVNNTNRPLSRTFALPNDPTITDWKQTIKHKDGSTTVVAGNISRNSPWAFHPLSDLPGSSWKIPDLAPFQGTPDLTIYAAVNLDLYLSNNPNGFLNGNWSDGQTLVDLGIQIVNGQIPGVFGIYWSTTDFTFDINSDTGWVPTGGSSNFLNSDAFQSQFGSIGILASHTSIPEPSTLSLVSLCLLGIFRLCTANGKPGRK